MVIEAKTDKVKETKEGYENDARVTTKQIEDLESGKGLYQEEDGGGSETEHPFNDAKVVRFEVTEDLISYSPSHPHPHSGEKRRGA